MRSLPFRFFTVAALIVFTAVMVLFLAFPSVESFVDKKADLVQYRCDADTAPQRHPRDPRFTARPTSAIKIIRLTNSGQFTDRCEYTDALFELNWDAPMAPVRPEIVSGAVPRPKLVVLYVHGWKHNGDEADTDLKHFQDLISKLRDRFYGKKNVVGIFVAWNAKAGLGLADNLTFWSKKTVSDRIAQSGVVTKIVASIGAMMHRGNDTPDQFVAIGHSFGARMLYSATAQNLINEAEKANPGVYGGEYKTFHGAADAVVLLNPAFEAAMYTSIDDFARASEMFSSKQLPVLITISTDNDWATKTAFPIGQFLGGARTELETTTLGNYDLYVTRRLIPSDRDTCESAQSDALTDGYYEDGLCLERVALNPDGPDPTGVYRKEQKNNPFFTVRTTSDVIDNHGGIWEPRFSSWLFSALSTFVDAKDAHR